MGLVYNFQALVLSAAFDFKNDDDDDDDEIIWKKELLILFVLLVLLFLRNILELLI